MRLLHAGPDHVRGRLHPRGPCRLRWGDPRVHVRQSLPVRGLSSHRRGRPRGGATLGGGKAMREFSYHCAGSPEEARQAATAAGAMLLAGGTTLLDLAKCGVAAPEQVIDITHLTGLDAIRVDGEGAF